MGFCFCVSLSSFAICRTVHLQLPTYAVCVHQSQRASSSSGIPWSTWIGKRGLLTKINQCDEKTSNKSSRTKLMKAANGRKKYPTNVHGVGHVAGNRRWVAINGRIEESINLSREEIRSFVRTSREINPFGVGEDG